MRIRPCLVSLITFVSVTAAQPVVSVADLSWIAGHWEMVKGDRITEELWLPPSGNTMVAVSRTVKGKKTIEYEFIVLEQDSAGDIYYNANPSGQKGTSFKLVRWDQTTAVFENLRHDFPQRILYHRRSEDSLIARIEGERNGAMKGIDYPYRRRKN